ncbi:hypothetical protein MRX96_019455 [Rhipicephalus microplus]
MRRSDGFVLERVSSSAFPALGRRASHGTPPLSRRARVAIAHCVCVVSELTRLYTDAAQVSRGTFGPSPCLYSGGRPSEGRNASTASRNRWLPHDQQVVVKARVSVRPNLEWGA